MQIKKYLIFVYCTIVSVIFCGCNCNEDTLAQAGKNRKELQKVLDYFKNDPDPLKYKAALFLIKNMPGHYTLIGKDSHKYRNIFEKLDTYPIELRDSVYFANANKLSESNVQKLYDIKVIKAGYLIDAINDACDVWRKVSWSKNYDNAYFYDYVLPYRLFHEPVTRWRECIKTVFPHLTTPTVLSERGIRYSAFSAHSSNCDIKQEPSAQNGKYVFFSKHNSCVSFDIFSEIAVNKSINFRFNTVELNTYATVELNGKKISTLYVEPTKSIHCFKSSKNGLPIHLKKGNNTLSIRFANKSFGLDYIELSSLETIDKSLMEDYSYSCCMIQNYESKHCVSMDTLLQTMLTPIILCEYSPNNRNLDLRLDYLGYPCWKISPRDDVDMCMEDRYVSLDPMAPICKYNYIRSNHQKWVFIPVKKGLYKIMNKDSGLFWDTAIDSLTGNEILVQNYYSGKKTQLWMIKRTHINLFYRDFFKMNSVTSEAQKVTQLMKEFEFLPYRGNFTPSLSSVIKHRIGTCQEESSYIVSLSRYLGIPTAVDFTPHWGNRRYGHSWSVLILPNGKATPLYMGSEPGDTTKYYHSYLKPKVYRHRYQMNKRIINDLSNEKDLPELFCYPDFIDVTDEYCKTSNVVRCIKNNKNHHKSAYICVFDQNEWVPVDYGKIICGKVRFKSMGRNILYSVGYYEYGKIIPDGNPFVITNDGKIREIVSNPLLRQDVKLLRKYPFLGKDDYFNSRMGLGKFQASNNKDFSDAKTLYTHEGITEGCWYEKKLDQITLPYKYLRYIGFVNSYCNINELEFFDENNKIIKGKIIGTDGIDKHMKETVFDGDILTGFEGNSPDGHWVGLELLEPSKVSKIRYMPRNDGNCVEVGDKYQLLMYVGGNWKTLAWKRAKSNMLLIRNIPSGGLFLLRDRTKGHEERIFTYENNKQVWW